MTNSHDNPTRYTQTIRRALLPPFAALIILAGLLIWQVAVLLNTLHRIDDSTHVVSTANHLQRRLIDMETGERGYLVGGDDKFLQPYNEAEQKIPPTFTDLESLLADAPAEREKVQGIRDAYADWAAEAQHELDLRRSAGAGSAGSAFITYFNAGRGKTQMDDLRGRIDAVISVASETKAERSARAQSQTREALLLAGISTLIVGGLIAYTTRRALVHLSYTYTSLLDAEQQAREYLGATLASIGDGVIVTDSIGRVTNLNAVAEQLTGWTLSEAAGKDSTVVFDIANESTGALVESPVQRVLRDGVIVGLANHTVLRRRDGASLPIDDSGAPIRNRDGAIAGVILVFRDVTERKRQVAILQADVDKNSHIAETLQRSLLLTPSAGRFPGLDVALRYQAALEEAQLGGDFFDAFALDDRNVAFVVGDVTGKGLAAAAYTAEIKFALRAMLREFGNPANALKRLNRFLIESHRLDGRSEYALVALSLAVVDCWTGDLRVAVAGAESPLIARAGRSAPTAEVEASGPLLGMDSATEYVAAEPVRLAPGDRLILVSDGITEARRGRSEFFGIEGISTVVTACPLGSDAEFVAAALLDGAAAFSGRLRDDVCVVVVQRTGETQMLEVNTIDAG